MAGFPDTASAASDETLDAYEIAVAKIPVEHLQTALIRFVSGEVPGQSTRWAPNPAQFATEARDHWYEALNEAAKIDRLKTLPPPEPVIVHSPEARARIAAKVEALVQGLASKIQTEEAAEAFRIDGKTTTERTNERFAPSMDPDAVRRRLMPDRR
jgi:hypothetical protein